MHAQHTQALPTMPMPKASSLKPLRISAFKLQPLNTKPTRCFHLWQGEVKERGSLCSLIGHTQAVTGVAWGQHGDVVSCAMDHTVMNKKEGGRRGLGTWRQLGWIWQAGLQDLGFRV